MIAVDTNVLVYAHREEMPQHTRAKQRVGQLAEDLSPWAIPVFCFAEFIRITTHPRVFDPPTPLEKALSALEALLASASLRVLHPGERYLALFGQAVREGSAKGNLVYDAQIVAVCREAGASTLLTEDRDFSRFSGLRIERL